jgi:DNA-binding IclR family transcriptional regulator
VLHLLRVVGAALTKQGYLEHAEDGSGNSGYCLGSAVLALGSAMLARVEVRASGRRNLRSGLDPGSRRLDCGSSAQ